MIKVLAVIVENTLLEALVCQEDYKIMCSVRKLAH